jgi:hypothetical protein
MRNQGLVARCTTGRRQLEAAKRSDNHLCFTMPLIFSSNPAPSDIRTQSSSEAQFGRQRFQKEQTSVCCRLDCLRRTTQDRSLLQKPLFLTRQRTYIGAMFTTGSVATQSNAQSSQVQSPAGAWSTGRIGTVVVVSFTTLWVFCLAFGAMSTDFVFNVEPPPSLPFEFRVFTSRMDLFADNRLPTSFKWRHYHIEAHFGRRPLAQPASEPQAPALGTRSTAPSPVLEYASIEAGGKVINTLTSETYSPPTVRNPFAIISRASRENLKHLPALALSDGMELGECWAFHGDSGQIGIQFTRPIRLSSLVVGHVNVPSATSAPKKLVLWGLKSTDNGLCDTLGDDGIRTPDFGPGYCGIHLLSGIHEPLASRVHQNFTIIAHDDHYFDRVVVQVLANWGHKTFTCIYRIQVYGHGQ